MSERSGARPGRPAERGARDPVALTILYRGPLASCNYDCAYCPFAKRRESAAELAADRRALERFVDWVSARPADYTLPKPQVLAIPARLFWNGALLKSVPGVVQSDDRPDALKRSGC